MTHLVANNAWGTVDFDTVTGQVVVREDWLYVWRLWPGVTAHWSYPQKHAAHTQIDRAIWAIWSNRHPIRVVPKPGNAAPAFGSVANVSFDVRWVLSGGHWTVTVWKMPPGASATSPHRSFVMESTHRIELNTADLAPRGAANSAGATTSHFVTPPHEYAHTMSNPDEYNPSSPHIADSASLVNIGGQIRGRHLHLVVDTLNRLAPKWAFSA